MQVAGPKRSVRVGIGADGIGDRVGRCKSTTQQPGLRRGCKELELGDKFHMWNQNTALEHGIQARWRHFLRHPKEAVSVPIFL